MSESSGSQSGRHPRPADIWLYVLDASQSEKDVVAAARDFLATWSPAEMSVLPAECRPGKIGGAEEISELAYRLSHENMSSKRNLDDRMVLERMMSFFVHANARLATFRSPDSLEKETEQ